MHAEEHPPLSRCENCETVLQGSYCHLCGQHGHNPLRSFKHALEDIFESFWHVDGRIFRTLRDLFIPGRAAINYLSGQRARYIPPLRLFLILSLVTFFVGKLAFHLDKSDFDAGQDEKRSGIVVKDKHAPGKNASGNDFAEANTVDEVLKGHAEAIKELEDARQDPAGRWVTAVLGNVAIETIRDDALARMRELKASPEQLRTIETASAAAISRMGTAQKTTGGTIDRWVARKLQRIETNSKLASKDPDAVFQKILGAIPGALLVLVPLFALLLKLAYLLSGRSYLEHLVVALYSHAFMLIGLLVVFLLGGLQHALGEPRWLGLVNNLFVLALNIGIPVYLLLMQKRVYAQGWPMTLFKFVFLGSVYFILSGMAMFYAVLAGFSS